MPRTSEPTVFVVAGTGRFPFDMLRYDGCYPSTGSDAAAIGLDVTNVRARDSRRVVKLVTHLSPHNKPTIGRWASFGWPVISHDACGIELPEDELLSRIDALLWSPNLRSVKCHMPAEQYNQDLLALVQAAGAVLAASTFSPGANREAAESLAKALEQFEPWMEPEETPQQMAKHPLAEEDCGRITIGNEPIDHEYLTDEQFPSDEQFLRALGPCGK